MKIYIKYMVSNRCKLAVERALEELGLAASTMHLGEVILKEKLNNQQYYQLKAKLSKTGLELMDCKTAILIEKIKTIIIEMVHFSDDRPERNFSSILSERVGQNYSYISNLFSQTTGTTVENYIISQKVERIKELLLYDELNITEISYKLNYSSPAHMSSQFKKTTGLTPTFFKKLRKFKMRIALEDL